MYLFETQPGAYMVRRLHERLVSLRNMISNGHVKSYLIVCDSKSIFFGYGGLCDQKLPSSLRFFVWSPLEMGRTYHDLSI